MNVKTIDLQAQAATNEQVPKEEEAHAPAPLNTILEETKSVSSDAEEGGVAFDYVPPVMPEVLDAIKASAALEALEGLKKESQTPYHRNPARKLRRSAGSKSPYSQYTLLRVLTYNFADPNLRVATTSTADNAESAPTTGNTEAVFDSNTTSPRYSVETSFEEVSDASPSGGKERARQAPKLFTEKDVDARVQEAIQESHAQHTQMIQEQRDAREAAGSFTHVQVDEKVETAIMNTNALWERNLQKKGHGKITKAVSSITQEAVDEEIRVAVEQNNLYWQCKIAEAPMSFTHQEVKRQVQDAASRRDFHWQMILSSEKELHRKQLKAIQEEKEIVTEKVAPSQSSLDEANAKLAALHKRESQGIKMFRQVQSELQETKRQLVLRTEDVVAETMAAAHERRCVMQTLDIALPQLVNFQTARDQADAQSYRSEADCKNAVNEFQAMQTSHQTLQGIYGKLVEKHMNLQSISDEEAKDRQEQRKRIDELEEELLAKTGRPKTYRTQASGPSMNLSTSQGSQKPLSFRPMLATNNNVDSQGPWNKPSAPSSQDFSFAQPKSFNFDATNFQASPEQPDPFGMRPPPGFEHIHQDTFHHNTTTNELPEQGPVPTMPTNIPLGHPNVFNFGNAPQSSYPQRPRTGFEANQPSSFGAGRGNSWNQLPPHRMSDFTGFQQANLDHAQAQQGSAFGGAPHSPYEQQSSPFGYQPAFEAARQPADVQQPAPFNSQSPPTLNPQSANTACEWGKPEQAKKSKFTNQFAEAELKSKVKAEKRSGNAGPKKEGRDFGNGGFGDDDRGCGGEGLR